MAKLSGGKPVTEIGFLEKHRIQLQNRNTVRAQGNYGLLPPDTACEAAFSEETGSAICKHVQMSEGPKLLGKGSREVWVGSSIAEVTPTLSSFSSPYLVASVKGDLFHVGNDA